MLLLRDFDQSLKTKKLGLAEVPVFKNGEKNERLPGNTTESTGNQRAAYKI